MKIGLQASILQGRRTGISNYCYNVLRSLSELDPELQFLSAGLSGWTEVSVRDASSIDDTGNTGPTSDFAAVVKSHLKRIRGAQFFNRNLNAALHKLYLPGSMALFHAFQYIPPVRLGIPTLPVIYDLSFIRFPDMHPKERVRWLSKLPKVVESARIVHTISEFSKREIAQVFGYPPERIVVAYPAAATLYRPLGNSASVLDFKKFDLTPERYLLAVGTLEPRKKLKTLVAAYAKLPAADRFRYPLVIVGGKGWGEIDLPSNTSTLVSEGSIRFLGYVGDQTLRSLYEGTRIMLFPSVYEGFGMPVVEAMACGAPIAHSEKTSMDEISGGLSVRIPALDVDAWAACMRDAIANDAELNEEKRQGRINRAHWFNWTDSARIIRKAYDDVIRS
jgi:glycosyltransferase involved in cell wall biosynthesis